MFRNDLKTNGEAYKNTLAMFLDRIDYHHKTRVLVEYIYPTQHIDVEVWMRRQKC